jgi:superfamily II DNA or RNA helicase
VQLQFDRGTLLLVDPPPDLDVAELPGVLWDSRVSAWRCPAFFHARLRAALHARGVRYPDNDPDPWPDTGQAVTLRPYQGAALAAWELGRRRGIVVLPTGSGKTRLALAAVARLRVPALCLVPTRVLLDQWARAAEELCGVEVGRYGDGEHTLRPLTIATFESAWKHMHGIGDRFTLLIVDEAHHFGSGGRDEALEMSLAPFRLGLTATPPRDRGRLSTLIGPTVFELSVGQLSGEFLAPFDQMVLPVELELDERTRYDALDEDFQSVFARFRYAGWDEFKREAGRSRAGRRALAAWRESRQLVAFPRAKRRLLATLLERHHADRVLVFTADNQTAYQVAREHLIMPLTCDIGRKEREQALAHFRDGTLRALVSAQVLNEGLDVPEAEVGIVVAGQRGAREHVQRLGRLLRPRPEKRALLYELVVAETREVGAFRRRRRAIAP